MKLRPGANMIDWWHGLGSVQLDLDLRLIGAMIFGAVLVIVIWRFGRLRAWLTPKSSDEKPPNVLANENRLWEKWSRIPKELQELHGAWLKKARWWEGVFYGLTISSVLLAAVVAATSGDTSNPPLLSPAWIKVVAVASAVSTGLLAALNPYKIHEEFIAAWRIVNTAKLEFLSADVRTAYYVAEQVRYAEDFLKESRRYRPPEPSGAQQQQPPGGPQQQQQPPDGAQQQPPPHGVAQADPDKDKP